MDPLIAGALAGAGAGGVFSAGTRYVLDRRSEHAQARAIAVLLHRELEDIRSAVDTAHEDREPWSGDHLDAPTWREQRWKLAGELDEDELLMVSTAMRWIAQANAWRASYFNEPPRRLGRARPRPFTEDDERLLFMVSSAVSLACNAIGPVRRGRKFFIFRRRVPRSLAPNIGLRCDCGHAFGRHEWRTRRRWLRSTRLRDSHHDVGGGCRVCDCQRFTYPEPSPIKRALRRLHLLPRTPYGHQTPPDADLDEPNQTAWRPSVESVPTSSSMFIRDRS